HALGAQAELAAGLGAVGDVDLGAAAVQRRHLDGAAERRLHERDRRAAMKVVAVALEDRVGLDRDEDVEVAGRPAIDAGLALARKTDARALLDARRHVDAERALLLDMARAAALLAGIAHDAPVAAALRTGALDGEE